MSLRIVFMGTPDFAVPTLTALIGQGHEIVAVYTRAPAPGGRGLETRPSPVHRAANQFGIPVLHPRSLKSAEDQEAFSGWGADLAVVVAYGLILPQVVLDAPRLGCVNLHGSLLPRWRGAAPIQRAVMAGDHVSGVGVMLMEAGLDTGPVGLEERVPIGPDMTAGELHDALAPLGADLMVRAVAAMARDSLRFVPQASDGVTYAAKIGADDSRIDWTQPAQAIHDQVRGLSPFPGAFVDVDLGRGPERLKILRTGDVDAAAHPAVPGTVLDDSPRIACGGGTVRLITVQRAGKAAMAAAEFMRGARILAGARLTIG